MKTCSVIVVNYNGRKFLDRCFRALLAMDYPRHRLELIMVDNGSEDQSVEMVRKLFPTVKILENSENNFCKALQLGTAAATGNYIGYLNNDTEVDERWLSELVKILDEYPEAGCIGGKMLFPDGRINSTGIREIEFAYFEDRGFRELDTGQYDQVEEVDYIPGIVLYRRECLEDVGPVDADFVMYFDDVDMSFRCRKRGWKVMYTPYARVYHEYQGTNRNSRTCYYFCNRNRFLYVAKHFPDKLPCTVKTAHVYKNKEFDMLYEFLPETIKKLVDCHDAERVRQVLPNFCKELVDVFGAKKIDRLLARMEVALGLRKATLCIYDAARHAAGSQHHLTTLAALLQDDYDVTYVCDRPINPEDPYDFFITNADGPAKRPSLSNLAIRMICHFPDGPGLPHFAAHEDTYLAAHGRYAIRWLQKQWRLDVDLILPPPVDVGPEPHEGSEAVEGSLACKENIFHRGLAAEARRFLDRIAQAYRTIEPPSVAYVRARY